MRLPTAVWSAVANTLLILVFCEDSIGAACQQHHADEKRYDRLDRHLRVCWRLLLVFSYGSLSRWDEAGESRVKRTGACDLGTVVNCKSALITLAYTQPTDEAGSDCHL